MIQKEVLKIKLKNQDLTTSMILKDKPQLTRTIDEIIYGVKNGYFTQIPTSTISDISWNDDEDLRTMKHKTNENISKKGKKKSISEIDNTAKINQERLIENLEIIQIMMANYYHGLEKGVKLEKTNLANATKTETKRIQELGIAEIRNLENKMKKLSKRDLIDKTNKIHNLAIAQVNFEFQLIKNAKNMDQEYATKELERIEKLLKKVKSKTFTTTPNEVGGYGSSQEFIPRNYTMHELIKIIQNSETNTNRNQNMFSLIVARKPETVTFCKLKKRIDGKLIADDNFFSGNIHEKIETFGELNLAKYSLDEIHKDDSIMELIE